MKRQWIRLIELVVGSWLLFSMGTLVSVQTGTPSVNWRPTFNTLLFALMLYAWSIFIVYQQRRFASALMGFVIVVYSCGFLSLMITAIKQFAIVSRFSSLVIIISLVGLFVNGLWFKTGRQLNKQQSS